METNKYAEQEIQDYAAGKFTGNKADFKEYLQRNPKVLAQVKNYQNLYSLLSIDQPPSLSFSLADKVIEKIQQKEYVKEHKQFKLLHYGLIMIAAGAIFFIYRYFNFNQSFSSLLDFGLFLVSAI